VAQLGAVRLFVDEVAEQHVVARGQRLDGKRSGSLGFEVPDLPELVGIRDRVLID